MANAQNKRQAKASMQEAEMATARLAASAGVDPVMLQAQAALAAGQMEPVIQNDGNGILLWVVDYEPEQTPRLDRLHGMRRWIAYGDDNLLPHQIIDLGRLSTTHSAILHKKADFTAGDAIIFDDPRLERYCATLDGGHGLHQMLLKCAEDYHAFGGFALQVRWKKYKREVYDFRHQPWHELRMGFDDQKNADGLYDQGAWLSYDWPRWTFGRKYSRPEFYKYFDPEEWCCDPVFYLSQRYTQGSRYYPLPSFFAAYKDVLTEIELVNFKYWSVSRAFTPAGIVRVFGRTDSEEVAELKKQLKALGGTMNAGKLMVAVSDTYDQAGSIAPVEFIPFNNNPANNDVTAYLEQGRQAIVTGHGLASATTIGINVATGLQSDAATLDIALKELQRSVIKDQVHICRAFNNLLKLAGFPAPSYKIIQSVPGYVEPTPTAP